MTENSKKVNKFIEQTGLAVNDLKVEPKSFLIGDVDELIDRFKGMKEIE